MEDFKKDEKVKEDAVRRKNEGDIVIDDQDSSSCQEEMDKISDDDDDDEEDDCVEDKNEISKVNRNGCKKNGFMVSYDELVRHPGEVYAMDQTIRLWKRILRFITFQQRDKQSPSSSRSSRQIRIPPHYEKVTSLMRDSHQVGGLHAALLGWCQRAPFLYVIVLYLVIYLACIVLFSFILHVTISLSHTHKGIECCTGFEFDSKSWENNFDVVFELSWTTFSTVGYGAVGVPANNECAWIRYILAVEAFLGILFASLCGAVFYSKIVRLVTQAHVTFSSCMCLQYGDGVTVSLLDVVKNEQRTDSFHSESSSSVTNFPIVEMRVVNDRAKVGGSEIIDASITCTVASIENIMGDNDAQDYYEHLLQENGDGCGKTMKRVFSDFKVTPDTHPYFSIGVWHFRHSLDHESPLLKADVKERIIELGGWPADLDSPQKIRDSFSECIDEILITFKGMSNLTADSVFLKQRYRLSDIYIGWRFAGMVYLLDHKKREKKQNNRGFDIDLSLIHDIVPTAGEAHESLGSRE